MPDPSQKRRYQHGRFTDVVMSRGTDARVLATHLEQLGLSLAADEAYYRVHSDEQLAYLVTEYRRLADSLERLRGDSAAGIARHNGEVVT